MKKRTVSIVVIVALVAVLLCFVGVQYLRHDVPASLHAVTTIDPDGMYDMNDLQIDSISETVNGKDISYPSIKGLKNKTVEKKINSELYAASHELVEKYCDDLTYANFYIDANFANVLSLSFQVGFDYEPYYEQIRFNYALTDGSHLTLEDLFLPDADLLSIIRESFYYSSVYAGEYEGEGDYYIYSPNEDEVYVAVRRYMAQKDKAFMFTPTSIYLYGDDNMATVSMLDNASSIVIYSKYLTDDSIFTGEYTGLKNLITCSEVSESMFEHIEYGYIEDNMWYDFTVTNDYIPEDGIGYDEEAVKLYQTLRKSVFGTFYSVIDSYRQQALENPDKFYAIFINPTSQLYVDSEYSNGKWHYDFSDLAAFTNSIRIYETDKITFENEFRSLITDTYRYRYFAMRGGAYIYDEDLPENVKYTQEENSLLYDYRQNISLTDLDDVFLPDSNYMSLIEDYVREHLGYREHTNDEIQSLIDEMTLSLNGTSIIASFPSHPDEEVNIYFDFLDKSIFKCFNKEVTQ